MPVMLKEDEVTQVSVRSERPLSFSKNGEMSASNTLLKRYSSVLLQDVTDTTYPNSKRKLDQYTISKTAKKINSGITMLNGYRSSDNDSSHTDNLPVATLSNMGNTCYLNSVLYTLRFAPSFLHNLHHLVADLALMHSKLNQTKIKSSSLGRNIGNLTGSSSRSSSNKDLLSFGNSQNELHPKSKMQIATEKLHELYMSLHNLEMKENSDSYQPASFLQALIDVNSIYQGHQQQDAHELLVYLLDILRETCSLLAKQAENQPDLKNELSLESSQLNSSSTTSKSWSVRRSWKKHKDAAPKKLDKTLKDKPQIKEEEHVNGILPNETNEATTKEDQTPIERVMKQIGFNFISEDFGGITLRRTKCLECESITERKEPFYDICVPITNLEPDLDEKMFYRSSCVTTENLRDTNKYWCEKCIRYNEARREVSYERLPNLLVLQLKRFSTTAAGTEKVNNYIPTPLVLECFCDQCSNSAAKQHSYQLYGVIMHLGPTMASGHYIAYTRASDHHYEYLDCCRGHSKTATFTSSTAEKSLSLLKFLKPKSHDGAKSVNNLNKNGTTNGIPSCKSMDCCGVRLNKSTIENVVNALDGKHNEDGQLWLECDDENIHTLTTKNFQKMLNGKRNSPATPYLLFYSKILENTSATNVDD